MDCIFCKIIEGKIPATKVFENEALIAIKDISPQAPIHYLFIPKEHIESINELPKGSHVMAQIFEAIQGVAQKEGFAKNGFRTSINTNGHGCQSVFHIHVHCLAGQQLGGDMTGTRTKV